MEALVLPHLKFCECGNPTTDGSIECRLCRERNACRAWRQHEVIIVGPPHIVRKDEVGSPTRNRPGRNK